MVRKNKGTKNFGYRSSQEVKHVTGIRGTRPGPDVPSNRHSIGAAVV
jgi:hypothetical protein